MIKDLITILIPCENSLLELKTTIESILKQTKIKRVKVIVLDNKSNDGSVQYVAQQTSDLFRFLDLHCVTLDGKNPWDILEDVEVNTPYCLWLTPGTVFSDPDFIMDHLNHASTKRIGLTFISKNDNSWIKNMISTFNWDTKDLNFSASLLLIEDKKSIEFTKESRIFLRYKGASPRTRVVLGRTLR